MILLLLFTIFLALVLKFELTSGSYLETHFLDDFEGIEVDVEKWLVQENVGTSGFPAYGGLITVADSHIFLTSNGSSFPCLQSVTNPFPLTGDFILEFDVHYTRVARWGTGLWVSNGSFEPSSEDPSQANVFQSWANEDGLKIFLLGDLIYASQSGLGRYAIRLEYSNGVYTVYKDGVMIGSSQSQLRPDTIGFGHPPADWVPFPYAGYWTSFEIDFVRILPYSLYGDLNGDGAVDVEDIYLTINVFGSTIADIEWNPYADLNWDDKIDIVDIATVIRQYGKSI